MESLFSLSYCKRMFFFPAVLIVLMIVLPSCSHAPKGSGDTFVAVDSVPDKVTIYHYRERAYKGGAMSYLVLSNGSPLTQIGNGGFFREETDPGETSYKTRLRQDHWPIPLLWTDLLQNVIENFKDGYSFDPEPGKRYYLRWTPRIFSNIPLVEQVPEDRALKEMAGLRSFSSANELIKNRKMDAPEHDRPEGAHDDE